MAEKLGLTFYILGMIGALGTIAVGAYFGDFWWHLSLWVEAAIGTAMAVCFVYDIWTLR